MYSVNEIVSLAVPVLDKNFVKKAGMFGSYAKNNATPNSDIDFIVELSGKPSIFKLGQLKDDLEIALGKECDVLTFCSISKDNGELAKEIQSGVQIFYEKY